jgi:hypothetical protein
MIDKAVMDFPHPLSPTSPKTSASSISKLRSLTILIEPHADLKKILRSFIFRRGTAGSYPPCKKSKIRSSSLTPGLDFLKRHLLDISYRNIGLQRILCQHTQAPTSLLAFLLHFRKRNTGTIDLYPSCFYKGNLILNFWFRNSYNTDHNF